MIPAWRGPRRPKSSRRSPGMEPRRRPPSGEERDGRTGFPRAGPWPATRGRVSCSGNPVAFASQAWTGGGRPARSARTRSSTRMPRASGSPNRPGRPSVTSLCASYFRSCATARCLENEAPSPASRPELSRERESPESGQLNSSWSRPSGACGSVTWSNSLRRGSRSAGSRGCGPGSAGWLRGPDGWLLGSGRSSAPGRPRAPEDGG